MADDVMLCECEGLGQELFVLAEFIMQFYF